MTQLAFALVLMLSLAACGKTEGQSCRGPEGALDDGESFRDDCNRCTCVDGALECTERACDPDPSPDAGPEPEPEPEPTAEPEPTPEPEPTAEPEAEPTTCSFDGERLRDGDTIDIDCNQCVCAAGVLACTDIACEGEGCEVDGRTVASGASTEVDCNTCFCSEGELSCTERDCTDVSSCEVNGVVYADGEDVPDPADCRSCSCQDGEVLCVSIGCPTDGSCDWHGVIHPNGSSFDDACNTCTCANGEVSCTDLDCGEVCVDADGTRYAEGSAVPSDDRCTTCECAEGEIECRANLDCPEPFCEAASVSYGVGDAVPSPVPACLADCECIESATSLSGAGLDCRDLGCDVDFECDVGGWPAPDGTDAGGGCVCQSGKVTCPEPGGSCEVRGVVYESGSTVPAPDGCNSCTCSDGVLEACSDAGCDVVLLTPCAATELMDFPHEDVAISNGYLTVSVVVDGGCGSPTFSLCYEPVTNGEATLHLTHDLLDDTCDGAVSTNVVFDLYPLTEAGHDEVLLQLAPHSVLYRSPE